MRERRTGQLQEIRNTDRIQTVEQKWNRMWPGIGIFRRRKA